MSDIRARAQVDVALDAFIYLDYKEADNNLTYKQIVDNIVKNDSLREHYETSNDLKDIFALVRKYANDPDIRDLKISNQTYKMPGYEDVYGCVFTSQDGRDAYVAFKGTGDGRWTDNGSAFGPEDSMIQQKTARYFDDVCANQGWTRSTNISVTGHSKGGNLAQYITMTSRNRELIDECVSFDGQGFSPEAIARMKKNPDYEMQRAKLYSISGENDPVNQLGNKIVPDGHDIYLKQDKNFAINPFDHHWLQAILDDNGTLNDTANGPGLNGLMFKQISNALIDVQPPELRQQIGETVMATVEYMIGDINKTTVYSKLTVALLIDEQIDPDNMRTLPENLLAIGIITAYTLSFMLPALIDIAEEKIVSAIQEKAQQLRDLYISVSRFFNKDIRETLNKYMERITIVLREAISAISKWYDENFNTGYKAASEHPYIRIDTDAYFRFAERIQNLSRTVSRIEQLLDNVYWWNNSLSLEERHCVGNANRRVGSFTNFRKCIDYFYETAEEFRRTENEISK